MTNKKQWYLVWGNEILSDDGNRTTPVRIWQKKNQGKDIEFALPVWRSRNYGIYPGLWESNNNWCNSYKERETLAMCISLLSLISVRLQLVEPSHVIFLTCTSPRKYSGLNLPLTCYCCCWNYRRQGIQWKN